MKTQEQKDQSTNKELLEEIKSAIKSVDSAAILLAAQNSHKHN